MPLYEYRCANGHDFEEFYRSIGTASSEAICPVCGAMGVRKMSTAGLVFKGSGFYITDYGKDGKKAERDAVTAEKSKADTAAAAKAAQTASSESTGSSAEAATSEKTKPAESSSSMQSSPAPAPVAPPPKTKTTE